MIHEYIITAFKVIVGVVTENRLALSALVALGVLLIWIFLSLVFSFQARFTANVKRINDYISRNGIKGEAKPGFELLLLKMPSEFQRGYKKFDRNPNSLPSDYINRFESIDMELSGGVFNQNKSVLKTYINFVFVGLLIFSLSVLPLDEALTGYSLAEAAVIPLVFFVIAKIMYYVYTATRQYQYKSAVEEFNYMLDNLDVAAAENYGTQVPEVKMDNQNFNNSVEIVEHVMSEQEAANEITQEFLEESTNEVLSVNEENEEGKEETTDSKKDDIESTIQEEKLEKQPVDNFKPDFSSLLEGEEVETVKRGRGRPRKEVSQTGEFVINNDKEFEDALVRAEKLMRKNEEPLSASQTKRIEKQIKELVDAMTKYKEGK